MSIWSTTYWIEGTTDNDGNPAGPFWTVDVATTFVWPGIRLSVSEDANNIETRADAYLSLDEARELADSLLRAVDYAVKKHAIR